MVRYNDIHNNITSKISDAILATNIKSNRISNINQNNINLASYTFFGVFLFMIFFYGIYNLHVIEFIKGPKETIGIIKNILSIIGIISIITIGIIGYIFYFYYLCKILFKKYIFLGLKSFYDFRYAFYILFLVFSITVILFIILDNNLILFTSLYINILKYTPYGYIIILLLSGFIYMSEFLIINRKDFSTIYIFFILGVINPNLGYKFLSKNQKKVIYKGFSNVTPIEINDINLYLIYGNKLENKIKRIVFWLGLLYIILQLLIGNFSLDTEKIKIYILSHIFSSILYLFVFVSVYFIYKILFTPSFIRNAYYVYSRNYKDFDV